jgi:alcohol dehydrogenase
MTTTSASATTTTTTGSHHSENATHASGIRALGFTHYGKSMSILEIPHTHLRPTELRIRVVAAGLNPIDWKRREGKTRFFLEEKRWPALLGYDASGIVESMGSKVTHFKIGDRVLTRTREPGTIAERCVVEEEGIVLVPEEIDLVKIAGLPLAGETALQILEKAKVHEGSSVLISGGSGGVGTFALQLAKRHFKCGRVVTSCPRESVESVMALGADQALVHEEGSKNDEFKSLVGEFDALIDLVGAASAMFKCGKQGATCVSTVAQATPYSLPGLGTLSNGFLYLSSFSTVRSAKSHGVTYVFHLSLPNTNDLALLLGLVREGKLDVVVDSVFKGLEHAREAYNKLESGRAKGKILIAFP